MERENTVLEILEKKTVGYILHRPRFGKSVGLSQDMRNNELLFSLALQPSGELWPSRPRDFSITHNDAP
jgi:hypothetical protein